MHAYNSSDLFFVLTVSFSIEEGMCVSFFWMFWTNDSHRKPDKRQKHEVSEEQTCVPCSITMDLPFSKTAGEDHKPTLGGTERPLRVQLRRAARRKIKKRRRYLGLRLENRAHVVHAQRDHELHGGRERARRAAFRRVRPGIPPDTAI